MKSFQLILILLFSGTVLAQPQNDLLRGIRQYDFEQIKSAIEAGADVNQADSLNETPLMYAVVGNLYPERKPEIVKYLLDKGAETNVLNDGNYIALHYAAYHAEAKILEMLLKAGSKTDVQNIRGETPLHTAFRGPLMGPECLAATKILVQAGSPVHVQDTAGRSPLILLCEYKAELQSPVIADQTIRDIAEVLLKAKAKIDAHDNKGHTALYRAVWHEHFPVAEFLLSRKANPKDPGFRSKSLLHLAVQLRNSGLIDILLYKGVDINAGLSRQWKPEGAQHFFPKNSTPMDLALISSREIKDPASSKAWKEIAKDLKKRGAISVTFSDYLKHMRRLQGGGKPPQSSKIR